MTRIQNKKFAPALMALSTVLALTSGCASTSAKRVAEISDNGTAATLQLSRDPKSTLSIDVSKEAKAAREELLTRKDLPQELLNSIAELSLLAGNPDEAAKEARELLKKDLKNLAAIKTLIKVQLVRNRPEQALLIAENALRDAPRDADILGLQGLAHFAANDSLAARASWKKALDANPSHVPSHMNLGALYYHNRNLQLAGASFEKALALQSQNSDAMVGKALVLAAQGQSESAKVLLTELLLGSPKSALVLYNLAVIEKERFQNFEAALGYTERYLEVAKNNRAATEKFIAQREDLKSKISKKGGPLTDQQLREMAQARSPALLDPSSPGSGAGSAPEAVADEKVAPAPSSPEGSGAAPAPKTSSGGVDVNTNDAKALEDAIK